MPAPLIPDSPPPQPGDVVTVTPAELERAISVWLKTMPKHLWGPYERMLTIDPKRRTEADRADPRSIVAAYLASQFLRVKWSATRIEGQRMIDGSGGRLQEDCL